MANGKYYFPTFQLGYRFVKGSYTAPYRDLPEFSATEHDAYELHRQMEKDFPSAEWRLLKW
jgi:hypothetical protein